MAFQKGSKASSEIHTPYIHCPSHEHRPHPGHLEFNNPLQSKRNRRTPLGGHSVLRTRTGVVLLCFCGSLESANCFMVGGGRVSIEHRNTDKIHKGRPGGA